MNPPLIARRKYTGCSADRPSHQEYSLGRNCRLC
jgi:hypothetical protein